MAAPDENTGRSRKFKPKWFHVVVVMVPLLMVIIVELAYLVNPPLNFSCFSCPALGVYKVSFGSAPGQVTFTIANFGGQDETIVRVDMTSVNNSAAVSTNTLVRVGTNSSLTVTFPNTIFQIGRTYNFTFFTSKGAYFPISAIR